MEYSLVVTAADLEEAVSSCREARICGVDTETTGLDPHTSRLRLIQLAVPGKVWVVDAWRFSDLSPIAELLADPSVLKVFHHATFDLKFLRSSGARKVERLFDTMLASQLLACGLEAGSHSLEALAEKRLSVRLDKTLRTSGFGGALSRDQVEYAASDAAVLLPLYKSLAGDLVKEGLVSCAKLEFAAVPAVADMEYVGITLDLGSWEELGRRIREKRDALRQKLDSVLRLGGSQTFFPGLEPPANPNSPAQVKAALAALGIDVPDTSESTLKGVLGLHPVVRVLLEYREQEKMLTAFIDKLPAYVNPATGRIHPTYDQLRAASGRFACRDPNIQQIPRSKEFRKCFVAPGGKVFVIADFSQVELRIAAALSGDKKMLEAYSRGEDLHRLTASVITGKPPEEVTKSERQAAKACNFGLIYGMSAQGLKTYARDSYGVEMTEEEAARLRERFFDTYRGIAAWHKRQRCLKEVRTRSGRLRRFPGDRIPPTELYNTPVQGTGADILKCALAKLRPHLIRTGAELVACVHDEVVVECPEERAEELKEAVEASMRAAGEELVSEVPILAEASVGKTWADKS